MSTFEQSIFERCALVSGLLTSQQLDEAKASLRADSPETAIVDRELADALVRLDMLNVWQTKQLLQGRTKFTLGPYRVVDSLGQGGMGHVYKAKDKSDRVVAIKVLPRERSTPEAIANFSREIKALASLNHSKLVRALDAGRDGNVHYLVIEFVPGSDLRKLVRAGGPLPMDLAASVISQVADGLRHAHEHGLVHRDVKPGNVLVTPEGEAKLSDLGLAGPINTATEEDPRHGKIVGTADYLSPDHITSPWSPTPAWDVYSLGCTMYYAVTGKVPFPGGTTAEKARAHCELRPLDPRRLNPSLSDDFVDVLADMMAKDSSQRLQSAAEVIERLAPWAMLAQWDQRAGPAETRGPPPLPSERGGGVESIAPPTLPPPLVVPPPVAKATSATPRLQDTIGDEDPPADSDESVSVIVDTSRQMPLVFLLILLLTPMVLAALALLISWLVSVGQVANLP